MKLSERIEALATLGSRIGSLTQKEQEELSQKAIGYNNWHTAENIELAFKGATTYLQKEKLKQWTKHYHIKEEPSPKTIGIVMAGNIPLVGLHDLITVLISGHKALVKLSSQDPFLIKVLIEELISIEPAFAEKIQLTEQLKEMDAVIATGSDNTARYFNYYFSKIPHIIRQNRSSCAILNGNENPSDLSALGKDIFQYFGLGCRNISKLYVPKDYNFPHLIKELEGFQEVIHHHKYANNYDYNKSIYLVNKVPHYDNGFLLLKESEDLVSPISVVYYETYQDENNLNSLLKKQENKIQCMVSKDGWYENSLPFGKSQQPELWDYADGVDTLKFVCEL
ncbi:acyl-CoA reductase [Cytophagales bacterium RKSG123]|nr:acyl-CoA reductase [Xanthovirga aplysinae]MTI31443.1 acyl-CoA reductase [Xanthovirga aplysinae]